MGKTRDTGFLNNCVFTDSSNNVGIGAAANASFKFQVTGTTNLTGALSGTSATFSGNGAFNTTSAVSGYSLDVRSATNKRFGITNSNSLSGAGVTFYTDANAFADGYIDASKLLLQSQSGGNVGIGTSSPAAKLDISGGDLFIRTGGKIGVNTIDSYNDTLAFQTGSTERMRITSGGQTQVLCPTSSIAALIVRNSAASVPAGQDILFTASPNNTSSAFLYCADNTEGKFVVWSNGDVDSRTNSYGGWSDIKLKENITDATPKLQDLLKVKIKNYNFIGDDKKQIGVVAQELEEIFPALISESPDFETDEETGEKIDLGTTTKSVKYSVFVPMLIKAMQEQQAQIEELKALIAAK